LLALTLLAAEWFGVFIAPFCTALTRSIQALRLIDYWLLVSAKLIAPPFSGPRGVHLKGAGMWGVPALNPGYTAF